MSLKTRGEFEDDGLQRSDGVTGPNRVGGTTGGAEGIPRTDKGGLPRGPVCEREGGMSWTLNPFDPRPFLTHLLYFLLT